ncbi:MAG TPA: ABC transporter permease [Thermotogota bacterium]|nr:ABC transporter permease [Thermotogota bacterium]HPJ87765.1 ABC transporter permease [Thermotogota bacterium]HPR95237.1 ABC transporter permease [Thermotogota bacterium]
MKAIQMSFMQMMTTVKKDMMLFMVCLIPLLSGLFFKFVIPLSERFLISQFSSTSVLSPYYGLFDVFFAMLAPIMFCFVSALVILEEMDDHIAGYLFVTPLGKRGYLFSRVGIPAILAFTVSALLLPVFKLTEISFFNIVLLSFSGTVQGIIIAMLIVTFSTNKLEGMAVAKLSSLLTFGLIGPFFLKGAIQYLLSPLPSFWAAKAIHENKPVYYLIAFIVSAFWFLGLKKGFSKKTDR